MPGWGEHPYQGWRCHQTLINYTRAYLSISLSPPPPVCVVRKVAAHFCKRHKPSSLQFLRCCLGGRDALLGTALAKEPAGSEWGMTAIALKPPCKVLRALPGVGAGCQMAACLLLLLEGCGLMAHNTTTLMKRNWSRAGHRADGRQAGRDGDGSG